MVNNLRRSPSKFKTFKKNLAKKMSIGKNKNKNNNNNKKQEYTDNQSNIRKTKSLENVNEIEELRNYGFDNDALNLSNVNQIYFMIGSVYIDNNDKSKTINLYQQIVKVRKTIHKILTNRLKENIENNDNDIVDVQCVNDLFFVKRV